VHDDDIQEWAEKDKQQELTDDIQERAEEDEQQELTDHDIIAIVNQDGNEDDEDTDVGTGLGLDKTERMIQYSKGVEALELTQAYVEQQGETAVTDVMLLRHWHVLTARKRSKAGKETSLMFSNSNFCHLP
jgi:hypothetical protein